MKYTVLLCDPPWKYSNPMDNKSEYGGTPYKQMSQEDLKDLPIKDIADKDCALFMWATLPKLPEAFETMKSWGFPFITVPFVWVKLNPNGKILKLSEWLEEVGIKLPFLEPILKKLQSTVILIGGVYSGLGHWTNGNVELVLMGKIGAPKRQAKNIKQVVFAPRGKHSRKPDEIRQRIVQLMGDVPRIELFATETVDGWDSIGGAIDGEDISDSLQKIIDK